MSYTYFDSIMALIKQVNEDKVFYLYCIKNNNNLSFANINKPYNR